jgi:hypothetical protein
MAFLIIAIISGIIWFALGYSLGKDFGQYTTIDHYETELMEDEKGKWFLRYTPYGSSRPLRNNSRIEKLTNKNS